ncbi:hypothetical protein [Anaerocolumna xylanovorans]|uniref:Lipoprotein n=1 Tax=Anaerocolumna xylanovorans DSM 12503 TaxID=1121345 RepID=A0A1M7YGP2_9FIRM|nr:hypothetical protein [Anaerocolumna xylanovorans]SHO51756.1 hypothetical protein SAMN02745217_03313 [Anaerocolumna xylanovorans DSM 12503]
MKKKSIYISIFLTLIFLLTACSKSINTDNTSDKIINQDANETLTHDNVDDFNIISTVNSSASLKAFYYNIDEFVNSGNFDAVVKGKITDIQYQFIGSIARSILTVELSETYYGDIGNISSIIVYEDGGYAKYSDVMESIKPHIDISKYSEEERSNSIVDYCFMDAKHSQVGDEVVMFLTLNSPPLPEDSFYITSSVFGKYTLNGNIYERPVYDVGSERQSEVENQVDIETMNKALSKLSNN